MMPPDREPPRRTLCRGLLLSLAILSGCRQDICERFQLPCDGTPVPGEWVDLDLDGWVDDEDCDDEDIAVHPAAPELCDGVDNDCDGETDEGDIGGTIWYADTDADGWGNIEDGVLSCTAPEGYVGPPGDCDDTNASIHPGMVDLCEGGDEDCDGQLDEDGLVDSYSPDGDGDGYATSIVIFLFCVVPAGYLPTPSGIDTEDCNDDDPLIHPGAAERCDGLDWDCDGLLGAEDPDLEGGLETYEDLDGDGWGEDTSLLNRCVLPLGSVLTPGDCDDSRPDIHPTAPETDCDDPTDFNCDGVVGPSDLDLDGSLACGGDCDDRDSARSPSLLERCDPWEVDEDCDGLADDLDDSLDPSTATASWPDLDGDGYGDTAAASSFRCIPDAMGWSITNDDCDDTRKTSSPSATDVCNSQYDWSCDGASLTCDWSGELLALEQGQRLISTGSVDFGSSVASAGDLDGDGVPELAISDPSGGDASAGRVVIFSTSDLNSSEELVEPEGAMGWIEGGNSSSWFGTGLGSAGDVDGDGFDDLVVGAPRWSDALSRQGAVLLFHGPMEGGRDGLGADWTLLGTEADQGLGGALLSLADLDGDGRSDLAAGGAAGNTVALVFAPLPGAVSADLSIRPTDAYGFGSALSAGDLDGDGLTELLIGARGFAGSGEVGRVYLFSAPIDISLGVEDATVVFEGYSPGDEAGSTLSAACDLDQDGRNDLVVGAPGGTGAVMSSGLVWVMLSGGALADASGNTSFSTADTLVAGESTGDRLGAALGCEADLDADGVKDLVAGAPGFNPGGATATGAAFVLSGDLDGFQLVSTASTARVVGTAGGDGFGGASTTALDLNQDGGADLVVGATGFGTADGGAAWVLYGAYP